MLTPVLIPIVFFVATAIVINNVLKYKIQRRIIDAGQVDVSLIQALLKPVGVNQDALKWGLLTLSGGLGLVGLAFLPDELMTTPLPFGIEAVCLSIGFLVYYRIIQRQAVRS